MISRIDRPNPRISPRLAVILGATRSPEEAERLWMATVAGDANAAYTLVSRLPKRHRASLVRELGHAKAPPAALRPALVSAWTTDHLALLAACPPGRLKPLFKRAAFDTSHLPETLIVWRGSRASLREASRGLAWSKSRERAAWLALWEGCIGGGRLLPPRRPGKPIVIRAVVPRTQVLAVFSGGGDAEVVLLPPVAATLETDDQAVVSKLARRAGALRAH